MTRLHFFCMVRLALIAVLLPACAASMVAGASTVTAAAVGASALQRSAGGCYATCTGGTTCNPRTGLCDRAPCDGLCKSDEHCESTATQSVCLPGPPGDVAAKAPGTQKTVPVLSPPSANERGVTGGPPQVTPAAEQNPPSHK
jgi:hypothetical protein